MIVLEQLPSLTLFVMMLAMGMGLELADFERVVRRPRAATLGVLGQLVLLPAVAVAIAVGLELPREVAAGLVLIAVCPGGSSSNAFSFLARGDVALSIVLTGISSLTAFLWVPLVLGSAMSWIGSGAEAVRLPFVETTIRLLFTTAIPVVAGLLVRRYRPFVALRWARPLLVGSISLLLLMIAALPFRLAAESVDLLGLFRVGGPAVLLLLLCTTGTALLVARAWQIDRQQSVTLAIEVGIQNFNLAMVLALGILHEPALLGTAIVYLPAMFVFAWGLVWLGRREAATQWPWARGSA